MSNVIEFKPNPPIHIPLPEPTLTIKIYDNPANVKKFEWRHSSPEPVSDERVQQYLADMFLSTLPEEPPGILQRAHAFFRNLFTPKDTK